MSSNFRTFKFLFNLFIPFVLLNPISKIWVGKNCHSMRKDWKEIRSCEKEETGFLIKGIIKKEEEEEEKGATPPFSTADIRGR